MKIRSRGRHRGRDRYQILWDWMTSVLFAFLLSIHEQRLFTDFRNASFKGGSRFSSDAFSNALSWPLIHWFQNCKFQQNMHDFLSFWPAPPLLYIKFAPNLTFAGCPCPAPPSCQQKWRLLHEQVKSLWNPHFLRIPTMWMISWLQLPQSPCRGVEAEHDAW